MSMDARVLVIGYGEMGHAMEFLLADHHRMQFWDIRPLENHEPVDLETAAAETDVVVYCVPVSPLGELAERVLPQLSADSISLSVAKGLDEAGRPAAAIFSDVYADRHHYGVLYGPMIAEEIVAGRPAFAQVGCMPPGLYERIAGLFANTGLTLEYSPDIRGISWASVLKNVYAMLFGVADELALGDNVRGYLAVASTREMAQIVVTMGGEAATVQQLAGLGDLVTTATSSGSHHHELGVQLARGELDHIRGEGIHTLAMVDKFSLLGGAEYPLFGLVQGLVAHPFEARQRIRAHIDSL